MVDCRYCEGLWAPLTPAGPLCFVVLPTLQLAFDLLIGAWMCRTSRRDGLRFWLVAPCLPITFLFGPAGFLAFSIVRIFAPKKAT
ncbi:MAG: DUF4281 domain-containing protein [Sulfitobacter sp.]|nr:DUF4281 domain-containing protein [Sulfitobacter sp.]